jgi:hypothetical protein
MVTETPGDSPDAGCATAQVGGLCGGGAPSGPW